MKKRIVISLSIIALLFSSCAELQNIFLAPSSTDKSETQSQATSSVLGDILNAVMGNRMLKEKNMYGQWNYKGTAVAFESKNLLKQAGGEIVASQIEAKFNKSIQNIGINSNNTYFKFNSDKTYEGRIAGVKISGKYVLDAENRKVRITYLMGIASYDAYIALSGSSMKLMMDADVVLKLIKIIGTFNNSTYIQVLAKLADTYDGMLLGFDLKKM